MAIIEQAFVESLEGNKLHQILKELVLKIDNSLMDIKKKNLNLLNFGKEEIEKDVKRFFKDFVADDSEDKFGAEIGDNIQKKMTEMQMQLNAKDLKIQQYVEQIEYMSSQLRASAAGHGNHQSDISTIYNEIDNLNKTIEHLRKENIKLRTNLLSYTGGEEGKEGRQLEMDKNLKIEEVEGLVDKLHNLELRIKTHSVEQENLEKAKDKDRTKIAELENEVTKLTKLCIEHEENGKYQKKEIEAIENAKIKIAGNLEKLIEDHESLKSKSLELLKSKNYSDKENEELRKEKSQLVDNILTLQKTHQEELNSLRSTLDLLSEKLYVVGLETENKQTFADLDTRHQSEKQSWESKSRELQDNIDQLEKESEAMESKIDEQHQIISMLTKVEGNYQLEKKKNIELEKEVDDLNNILNDVEKERDLYQEERDKLSKELNLTQKERAKAHEECQNLSSHRKEIAREKTGLESALRDQEAEISNLKKEVDSLSRKLRENEGEKEVFKSESANTNEVLKLSKEEIQALNEQIAERKRECEIMEKDRNFFKKKVERLEDQLFQKEKKHLRDEAEKEVNTEDRLHDFSIQNERLKEELIVLERANSRLFSDVEYYKSLPTNSVAYEKLRAENDRLRELFKRAEINWLRERQSMLQEIDVLRDQTPAEGYRTVRNERQDYDKETRLMSTYGSGFTKGSPSMPKLLDATHSKSFK